MSRRLRAALVIALIPLGIWGYTLASRSHHGTAPAMAAPGDQADRITVDKPRREMTLWQGDRPMRRYQVSLGRAPEGRKEAEGDQRTPEGRYHIDGRNERSIAHLALHISYPDEADRAAARARGLQPGGAIMIHGMLNGWGWLGSLHRRVDWTNGCIAVTNAEMREIWSLVPDGIPIEITGR